MLIRHLTGDDVEVSGQEASQEQAAAAGTANPSSVALGKECEQWWRVGFFSGSGMFLQYISC